MSSSRNAEDPPCKRQKNGSEREEEERKSPFDLLALPDPVLMETLRLVDRADRMRLSHTSQSLRNMIMRNKTPSMDRRKQIPWCSFVWRGNYTGNYVSFPYGIAHLRPKLDANCSFVEQVQRFTSLFDCDEVCLEFFSGDHAENIEMMANFTEVVKALGGVTKLRVMFDEYDAELMKSLLNDFIEYPHFYSFKFNEAPKYGWADYCTTVTQVCNANGIVVKTEEDFEDMKYGLRKLPDEEGKRVIQILDGFRPRVFYINL